MDWQQIASLFIVGLTAVLLVRHEWRRRQRAKLRPCGHDCCASALPLAKPAEPTFREKIVRTQQ